MTPKPCIRESLRRMHATRREVGAVQPRSRFRWNLVLILLLAIPPAAVRAEETGTISGRVFDGESGTALENATIILAFPDPGDGSDSRQEIATSGPAGDYEFDAVPAGDYALSFVKSGYRASSITSFVVAAGQDNVANFPMPPQVVSASGDVMELDAFVVEADLAGEMMNNLELRLESDQSLNLLSAEDLSKYAASDVADALKRVAGVNIVEGQFAIIRGLEDRYSSTLFNGAPIPSPDPNSQSVQLDLFPSDVVTNLIVAKTFVTESPSNSAAGSIDIVTQDFPEEPMLKLSVGAGFEEGAHDNYLEYQSGSTAGKESNPKDITETDVGGSFGGHHELWKRVLRFKTVVNHEIDHRTAEGIQEGLEPRVAGVRQRPVGPPQIFQSGSLAYGELPLSEGRFDQTTSTREEQLTTYVGLGIDLDEEGKHRVDYSFFYTKKDEKTVEQRENGYFTNFDYSELIQATNDGDELLGPLRDLNLVSSPSSKLRGAESALRVEPTDSPSRGALWFASFGRTNSFERDRDLYVYQLNGEHEFDLFEGLKVSWAANRADTNQKQTSLGMRFTYEPCGYSGQFGCPAGVTRAAVPETFPVQVQDLGVGNYFASSPQGGIVFSENKIKESQWFGRMDADQDVSLASFVDLNVKSGVWWEKSNRNVDAFFVDNVLVSGSSQWALASPTLQALGDSIFDRFDSLDANRDSTTRSKREITAGYLSLKTTFWEDVDIVGGVRVEDIYIDSKNEPFTGETQYTRPVTFPTAYLFFDRLDNPDPALGSEVPFVVPDKTFNDQILGINSPVNPNTGFVDFLTREEVLSLVDGQIDEFKVLPSVGLAYRLLDGVTLRAAYSQTVARPSFREMGYYVSVEPGSDEQTVGNPQLKLSEIESYDLRAEYVFGEFGDLFAVSGFYKVIDDPIESIVVRNPLDFSGGNSALFRTFFNNTNTARLWGIEVEARKSFDFIRGLGANFPGIGALDYLSIGGNFTYIKAKVGRSPAEISRFQAFFDVVPGEVALYNGLDQSRRLFGQPEWIVNADISFDYPEWGTTATLAVFAISDVLEAAGSASLGPDGYPVTGVLDRYNDEFYQLDFVVSQRIWRGLKAKMSVKNLTNSARRRVYDQQQTQRKYTERKYRTGRDWSFSLAYTFEF